MFRLSLVAMTALLWAAPSAPAVDNPRPAADAKPARDATLPLAPASPQTKTAPPVRAADPWSTLPGILGSLGIAVGLFMLVMWLLRRAAPKSFAPLPGEVFEVLGRAPLAGRQQVHLLRLGRKLLLVSVTPGGAEALAEVTDAEEVDRLLGLCQATHSNSNTTAFRQTLRRFASRETDGKLMAIQ